MFLKIVLVIALLIIGFLIVVSLRPATFRYTRSITIAAPPGFLFEQVNDLHRFQDWNPWARLDPSARVTYVGPASGVGAAYTWMGNNKIGEGTMTILESRLGEYVKARMDFRKPFAATNVAEFTFQPLDGKTLVTWSISGPDTFPGKAMGLFINIDKMVGGEFEKGLATLKIMSESSLQK